MRRSSTAVKQAPVADLHGKWKELGTPEAGSGPGTGTGGPRRDAKPDRGAARLDGGRAGQTTRQGRASGGRPRRTAPDNSRRAVYNAAARGAVGPARHAPQLAARSFSRHYAGGAGSRRRRSSPDAIISPQPESGSGGPLPSRPTQSHFLRPGVKSVRCSWAAGWKAKVGQI